MSRHAREHLEAGPLHGAVLCSTAVLPEQRIKTEIGLVSRELGAAHNLDLTSETTHLLVGHIDTSKYKYVAKERHDVKVLRPDWLDAVRASWMQGGETDVAALEKEYKFPTFSCMNICITGFEQLQQRLSIMQAIEENGAKYHGDLTRVVTHLVCAQPQGKKYEYARQWKVKCVSVEWISDSLKRGMALDESCYDPLLPLEDRGKGAVNCRKVYPPESKRKREAAAATDLIDYNRRKLRRTASAKFENKDSSIWADMTPAETSCLTDKSNDWEYSTAVAPISLPADSSANGAEHRKEDSSGPKQGILSGCAFWLHPSFDSKQAHILDVVVCDNGGCTVTQEELRARRVNERAPDKPITAIVPHDFSQDDLKHARTAWIWPSDPIRTYLWLEYCIARKALYWDSNPLYEPLPLFPIPGFERIIICPTSFVGMDLLHFSKTVKLVGATYDEACSKKTSVIVGHNGIPNLEKLRYALNHGIPVVSADWFLHCVARGQLLPLETYFPPAYAVEYSRRQVSAAKRTAFPLSDDCFAQDRGHLSHETGASEIQDPAVARTGNDEASTEEHPRIQPERVLQELNPAVNSPPKQLSTAPSRRTGEICPSTGGFSAPSKVSTAKEEKSDTALNSALRLLLDQRKAAQQHIAKPIEEPSRRHKKLGRAISHPSSATGQSFDRVRTGSASESEAASSEAQEQAQMAVSHSINPSQTLSYEDSEVLAARQKLLKRLGKESWDDEDVHNSGTRVESIGQVEDATVAERGARRKARKSKIV